MLRLHQRDYQNSFFILFCGMELTTEDNWGWTHRCGLFNPLPSCISITYINNVMLNGLQKYYHPEPSICALRMPNAAILKSSPEGHYLMEDAVLCQPISPYSFILYVLVHMYTVYNVYTAVWYLLQGVGYLMFYSTTYHSIPDMWLQVSIIISR